MLNERILNSVGRQNYKQYMIITDGKEIDEILDSRSPIFKMYKYRDKLLDKNVGQDIQVCELERLLTGDEDSRLKEQLELLFLESISNSKFKIIKNILAKHKFGWSIERLVEIHKKHTGYRIFRIVSIEYKNWLN